MIACSSSTKRNALFLKSRLKANNDLLRCAIKCSRRALQPLQGFEDFFAAGGRFFVPLAFQLHLLFGGFCKERRIAELRIDSLEVGFDLCHFIFESRALGREFDDASKWK